MHIAVFDTHDYERPTLEMAAAQAGHKLTFFEERLRPDTALLASGHRAVCVFVNDVLDRHTLDIISAEGVELIALRCAGFNNVDLDTAARLHLRVVRVPEYSPYAVAEHTLALLLALNRRIHRAHYRSRERNFSLEGMVGTDVHGKTVGVIGTGKIGAIFGTIMHGLGCRILAHDMRPNEELVAATGAQYVAMPELLGQSDFISLHVPLLEATHHIISRDAIARMKPGAYLLNTSRGGLVDAAALIDGLKSGQVGAAGLDVYEEEADVFFEDHSDDILQDDILARLLTFPNVIITSHQAFLTVEALENIAETTMANVTAFEKGHELTNELRD
ncbi:MAG: 2-hydroxyacid dehydrogenase [Verrucomicrobiota bacterium]